MRSLVLHKILWLAVLGSMTACSNIECPLDNQVEMTLAFYDVQTEQTTTISDTLTVYGLKKGTEQLYFNRGTGIKSLKLSLNPAAQCDTLLLRFSNPTHYYVDTLVVNHTPLPHFESLDCPAAVFHTLRSVRWVGHALTLYPLSVDSVAISNSNVHYEDVENLKVFLRTAAQ